jgi:hypothetical protein
MADNHQIALDPYELEYELAELEKLYAQVPNTAESLAVKANLQIQMDQKLTELGRPTRYYAKSELRAILDSDGSWPTIPRDSYPEAELEARAALFSAPPAIRGLPRILPLLAAASGDQVATGLTSGLGVFRSLPPKKCTVGGCETYTIDGLIERLRELRSELGGSVPVWRDITDGSGVIVVTQPIGRADCDLSARGGSVILG